MKTTDGHEVHGIGFTAEHRAMNRATPPLKTMTRRVITGIPKDRQYGIFAQGNLDGDWLVTFLPIEDFALQNVGQFADEQVTIKCPYGTVGDYLYTSNEPVTIKNTFKYKLSALSGASLEYGGCTSRYAVIPPRVKFPSLGRWPGRVLPPEWAHPNGWLRITSLAVERVQDISEADAIREGIRIPVTPDGNFAISMAGCKYPVANYIPKSCFRDGALEQEVFVKAHYASLWDTINAKRGYPWANNGHVWVIGYEQAQAPELEGN